MKTVRFNELIDQINRFQQEAKTFGCKNVEYSYFSTAAESGQPSVRIITIYEISERGFLFVANKNSGKIQQLKANPKAGLCFYWDEIHLQITVEGTVVEMDKDTSNELWQRRDHRANIQSWAIDMAQKKGDSDSIEAEKNLARQKFQGNKMPIADSWSAYSLKPNRIELWQSEWRKGNKHQCYTLDNDQWSETQFFY